MTNRRSGFRTLVFAAFALVGLFSTSAVFAHGHVSIGINLPGVSIGYYGGHHWRDRAYVGVGYPGGYYGGYYAPAYYYDDDDYYYAPAPVAWGYYPRAYYGHERYYGHYYGASRARGHYYHRGYHSGGYYHGGRDHYYHGHSHHHGHH